MTLHNFEKHLHQSFPPCMRHLVLHQRSGKHLKNLGRLQLRPFLREAGLSLAEAWKWWERELCRDPLVSPAKFREKHAYQVEHAHGANGHGRGAFAFSCRKQIGFQAPVRSTGQVHGCPFQHLPPDGMSELLRSWALPEEVLGHIVQRARDAGPTLACADFFAATHPTAPSDLIGPAHHPNEFLRRSCRALKGQSDRAVQAPPSAQPAPSEPAAFSEANKSIAPVETPPVCSRLHVATPSVRRPTNCAAAWPQGLCLPSTPQKLQPVPSARNSERVTRRPPVRVAKGPFLF